MQKGILSQELQRKNIFDKNDNIIEDQLNKLKGFKSGTFNQTFAISKKCNETPFIPDAKNALMITFGLTESLNKFSIENEKEFKDDYYVNVGVIASKENIIESSEKNTKDIKNKTKYEISIELACEKEDKQDTGTNYKDNINYKLTQSAHDKKQKELVYELERESKKYIEQEMNSYNKDLSLKQKEAIKNEEKFSQNKIDLILTKAVDKELKKIKNLIDVVNNTLKNYKSEDNKKGFDFKVAIAIKRCCKSEAFTFSKEVYDSEVFKSKIEAIIKKYGGKIIGSFGKKRRSNKRKSPKSYKRRRASRRRASRRRASRHKSKKSKHRMSKRK